MGMSGYFMDCCKSKDPLIKSMIVPVSQDNSTIIYKSIQETDEDNKEKKIQNKISHYGGFTKEEIEQINEKININFDKYQKAPVKSSDINIIYQSGIIRSNSSYI